MMFYWVFGYVSIPLYYTKIIRLLSKLGLLDIEMLGRGDYTGDESQYEK
jgi:hypothetical protein